MACFDVERRQEAKLTERWPESEGARMQDHAERGWAPATLRDVGEDESDAYVVGVREARDRTPGR
jgi:hypothetical protein